MVRSNNGTGKIVQVGKWEKVVHSENIRLDQVLSELGHNIRF